MSTGTETIVLKDISDIGINSTSRILILFPHPDDESFATAGFIQQVLKIGAAVKIVIFTLGEASTLKNGLKEKDSLSDIRSSELDNAMKILNVSDYSQLDFADGHMDEFRDSVSQKVKDLILDYKPTLLVTYEPCGVYGHVDHVMLSEVVQAYGEDNSLDVLFCTVDDVSFFRDLISVMARNPETVKPLLPEIKLKLSMTELITKLRALASHKSQTHNQFMSLTKLVQMYKLLSVEYFVLRKNTR